MHYLQFFKLNAEPFSQALASQYFYSSEQHSRVLDRLAYGVESRKGLVLVTGAIGHGKSTLARRFLSSLSDDHYSNGMVVMVHGGVTAGWLLRHIATTLGVANPVNNKLHLLAQLHERLLEIERLGKRAVVIIDEAQMLDSRELMEELRGLLNLESPRGKLLTLILFGLPEIVGYLELDPPLAQRVALRCNLGPLGLSEVEEYISHRMRIAGIAGKIFSMSVLREIYRWTRGVPRVINTLCDNVLLELFFRRERIPDPALVSHVAVELGLARENKTAPKHDPVEELPLPPSVPEFKKESSVEDSVGGALEFCADEIASSVAHEKLNVPEEDDAFEETAKVAKPKNLSPPAAKEDIADPLDFLRLPKSKSKRSRTAVLQDAIETSKMEVAPNGNGLEEKIPDGTSTIWDRSGSRNPENMTRSMRTRKKTTEESVDTGRINSLIDEAKETVSLDD